MTFLSKKEKKFKSEYLNMNNRIFIQLQGERDSPDNEAINSLTVTIVTVSIVALALLAALVYLVVFLVQRRQ